MSVFRKLVIRIAPEAEADIRCLTPGERQLLREELELFCGTEWRDLYRSEIVEGKAVYEIGVGAVVLVHVMVYEEDECVYVASIDILA